VPNAGTRRGATAIEGVLGATTLIFSTLFFFFCLPNRRRGSFARNRAAIAHACPDRGLYAAAAIHCYLIQLLLAIPIFLFYVT
jgi:hypothetical protein